MFGEGQIGVGIAVEELADMQRPAFVEGQVKARRRDRAAVAVGEALAGQVGIEGGDEVIPEGVLGAGGDVVKARLVHASAVGQEHVEVGFARAGGGGVVRVVEDVGMAAVVVGEPLEFVEGLDAVGQAVRVHLAQERGAAGNRKGQDRQFDGERSAVGELDRAGQAAVAVVSKGTNTSRQTGVSRSGERASVSKGTSGSGIIRSPDLT